MKVSDFDYELPAGQIAQVPAEPRDAARLLVHRVALDETVHLHARDLAEWLQPQDLLVVNDARVLPARLWATRTTGGRVELLFLEPADGEGTREGAASGRQGSGESAVAGAWRALGRPARKLREGELLEIEGEGGRFCARALTRELLGGEPGAVWRIQLRDREGQLTRIEDVLERVGHMPLPPYIARPLADPAHTRLDRERYQTVYAQSLGAVAAPTAGLHFTEELLARIAERGVERARVTLHVGLGTFRPVSVERVDEHVMHAERIELPPETVQAVERCRARGGRVIAVGTTSVRVLEARANEDGVLTPGVGHTDLFITPGRRLRVVDALMTNFHLPRSTLLMLVSAFAGRERILRLYREAIERGYRFYSYGDAMLLLP